MLAVLPPLVVILCSYSEISKEDVLDSIAAYCTAMVLQLAFVCVLKNITGLPRPDMLDRCWPSASEPPVTGLSNITDCTNPDLQLLREGFRTFPSGHSSTAFTGATLQVVFSYKCLAKHHVKNVQLQVLTLICPLFLATIIACSRVSDNRHSLADVTCGSSIGIVVALTIYWNYFPKFVNRAVGRETENHTGEVVQIPLFNWHD